MSEKCQLTQNTLNVRTLRECTEKVVPYQKLRDLATALLDATKSYDIDEDGIFKAGFELRRLAQGVGTYVLPTLQGDTIYDPNLSDFRRKYLTQQVFEILRDRLDGELNEQYYDRYGTVTPNFAFASGFERDLDPDFYLQEDPDNLRNALAFSWDERFYLPVTLSLLMKNLSGEEYDLATALFGYDEEQRPWTADGWIRGMDWMIDKVSGIGFIFGTTSMAAIGFMNSFVAEAAQIPTVVVAAPALATPIAYGLYVAGAFVGGVGIGLMGHGVVYLVAKPLTSVDEETRHAYLEVTK